MACLAQATLLTVPCLWQMDVNSCSQHRILKIIQISAALVLALTNISIPKAPDVYLDGRLVERHGSVSFLSRCTFWWATETLVRAAKTGRLDADDLPIVAHEERAQTLYARFSASPSAKIWRKLLRIYSSRLLLSFVVQLLSGASHFLPQLLLFNMLRLLEQREAGVDNQLPLWITAAGLGGSLVVSSWLASMVIGLADLKLSLPIQEQLFAVIVNKAMRLEDTVSMGSGGGKRTDESDSSDDDDDDHDGPRTRSSILNLLVLTLKRSPTLQLTST